MDKYYDDYSYGGYNGDAPCPPEVPYWRPPTDWREGPTQVRDYAPQYRGESIHTKGTYSEGADRFDSTGPKGSGYGTFGRYVPEGQPSIPNVLSNKTGTAGQVNRKKKADRLPMIGEPGYQAPQVELQPRKPAAQHSAYPGLGDSHAYQAATVSVSNGINSMVPPALMQPPVSYMLMAMGLIFMIFLAVILGGSFKR